MCKHEIGLLIGTADGIVCKGCGKLFKSFDEIRPVKEEVKPAEEKPKKARKKKEA